MKSKNIQFNSKIDFDDFRIHFGLNELIKQDSYLLEKTLSERCIVHKLAEHYQRSFFEWNVDCEFNRNLDGIKEIELKPENILQAMANSLEEKGYLLNVDQKMSDHDTHSFRDQLRTLGKQLRDPKRIEYIKELDLVVFKLEIEKGKTKKKRIFPDIIIHQRGTKNNNIVIEVKKSKHGTKIERAFDMLKLIAITSQLDLNYKRGYFIDLPVGKDFEKFKQFAKSKKYCDKVYQIFPDYKVVPDPILKRVLESR